MWSLTALWGSMLAIFRACSMAYSDGLQITGVLGSSAPGFGWAECSMMSKIFSLFIASPSIGEFRVSKQMIPSKQSSRPSLLRALAAWTLSAFVNICVEEREWCKAWDWCQWTAKTEEIICFRFKKFYHFANRQAQQKMPENWVWLQILIR